MSIWHWKDAHIQPMQQVDETRDKNFSYLCLYRVAEQKFVRLADRPSLRDVRVLPEYAAVVGLDKTSYELDESLNGIEFTDVYTVDLKTGAREKGLTKVRWLMSSSPNGSHLLYYDDGSFYTFEVAPKKTYNITAKASTSFVDTEDDHNQKKPPTEVIGWAKDSSAVLLTDNWDIWLAPVHGGSLVNLTGNGKKDGIRYVTRFRLDPEEKGIDLAKPIYVRAYGERSKKGGIARIEASKPGVRMLAWDDGAYGSMLKARDADTYLFTRETTQEFPDYRVAGPALDASTRITEANPQQKDFLWTKGSRVIDYSSTHGDKLQAALFLPANYEPGKSYPTIVYIYEKLSQGANQYPRPGFAGVSVLRLIPATDTRC